MGGDGFVSVAYVGDRMEGELLHGMLADVGIPSLVRPANPDPLRMRYAGFGFGPQEVLVNERDEERARALLAERLAAGEEEGEGEARAE